MKRCHSAHGVTGAEALGGRGASSLTYFIPQGRPERGPKTPHRAPNVSPATSWPATVAMRMSRNTELLASGPC